MQTATTPTGAPTPARWTREDYHRMFELGLFGDGRGVELIDGAVAPGIRMLLREGCDRTLQTCATRFGNAVNFQGEPFLPGNDLVARYPSPAS